MESKPMTETTHPELSSEQSAVQSDKNLLDLFAERDASRPGSNEEEIVADKILKAVLDRAEN